MTGGGGIGGDGTCSSIRGAD